MGVQNIYVLVFPYGIIIPNGISHFWCQVQDFDTYRVVYPFAKDLSLKINPLRVITFDDESASDAQKRLASPKRQFLKIFFKQNRAPIKKKNIAQNFAFGVEKMKRRESSETRFA